MVSRDSAHTLLRTLALKDSIATLKPDATAQRVALTDLDLAEAVDWTTRQAKLGDLPKKDIHFRERESVSDNLRISKLKAHERAVQSIFLAIMV